jgi:hypothetical protein
MKSYRFSVGGDVSVCFSIEAETEDSAIQQAQTYLTANLSTVPLSCVDDGKELMLYVNDEYVVTSEDIMDIEEVVNA